MEKKIATDTPLYRHDAAYPFPKGTGESAQREKAVCSEKAPESPAGHRAETRQRESAGALIMADTRDISMHFWATQEEYDLIQKNMALSGSTNLSAFLRKMAIDGMVIKLDMPEIQEMLHLLRRANANINQIARYLHDIQKRTTRNTRMRSSFAKRPSGHLTNCFHLTLPAKLPVPTRSSFPP